MSPAVLTQRTGRVPLRTGRWNRIFDLPVFPSMVLGGCTIQKRNAYVIRRKVRFINAGMMSASLKKLMGNVGNEPDQWNMGLVAEEMIEGSYLEDEECKSHFLIRRRRLSATHAHLRIEEGCKIRNLYLAGSHLEGTAGTLFQQKRKKVCDGCNWEFGLWRFPQLSYSGKGRIGNTGSIGTLPEKAKSIRERCPTTLTGMSVIYESVRTYRWCRDYLPGGTEDFECFYRIMGCKCENRRTCYLWCGNYFRN